jgi:hypothetical protein
MLGNCDFTYHKYSLHCKSLEGFFLEAFLCYQFTLAKLGFKDQHTLFVKSLTTPSFLELDFFHE